MPVQLNRIYISVSCKELNPIKAELILTVINSGLSVASVVFKSLKSGNTLFILEIFV